LRRYVEEKLRLQGSPQQISRRFIIDHPHDGSIWVSHETINTSLFVQSHAVRKTELALHLRTLRVRRRPQRHVLPRSQSRRIPDMGLDQPAARERLGPNRARPLGISMTLSIRLRMLWWICDPTSVLALGQVRAKYPVAVILLFGYQRMLSYLSAKSRIKSWFKHSTTTSSGGSTRQLHPRTPSTR
jgi:hypothetical protein